MLELRSQSRKLQWYGEVNRRGFIKILKKLDKKVPTACAQQRYIGTRVEPRPFASNAQLSDDVNTINTWLSKLADYVPPSPDDESSPRSSLSLSRSTSKTVLSLPAELLDNIDRAIRKRDVTSLEKELAQAAKHSEQDSEPIQRVLLSSLQRAIASHSRQCMTLLLQRLASLDEPHDINKRNCIHRLVIAIGRARVSGAAEQGGPSPTIQPKQYTIIPAEAPNLRDLPQALVETDSTWVLDTSDKSVELLEFLLHQLPQRLRPALAARDVYGRLPLHYAAKYGFASMCQAIVTRMTAWTLFDATTILLQDLDGNTPIYYSVVGGHPITTSLLLDQLKRYNEEERSGQSLRAETGRLLSLATKTSFVNILKALLRAGADVNAVDDQGETALHLAARFGHVECAKALLSPDVRPCAKLNIQENTFGWTPLLVASVDGQLPMVEFLVEAGADVNKADSSGWHAAEHAALRGHMEIAALLAKRVLPAPRVNPTNGTDGSPPKHGSLSDRASHNITRENSVRNATSVKSFGHRYLTKDSLVLVSLGSMDPRKDIKPVKLDNIPLAEAHATQLDTALSVIVSASGATGEPTIIDLPVQDNISTEPIAFYTSDITKVKLLFDIVPTYAGSQDTIVGRGVALLSTVKQHIGSKRMNLQGDISVPIVAAKTLDFLGVVNFNFLIITPFSHPNMAIAEDRCYWKSTAPLVIGHRGLGKNTSARKSLQLGENTIQSFIAAANLGASYVEFDVQLTKDHVPIIYHDFLVSETGIDAPVHTLTLEQFLHVSDLQTPRPSRPSSPDLRPQTNNPNADSKHHRRQQRANSLGAPAGTMETTERMKHTRDFKLQGYKGNSRGTFIQAPFTTLEEMFRKLPPHIGFNIEMKYPMLFETEDQGMDSYAIELNSFVDSVLKMVYELSNGRDIIFSSFHPDICLLLSFKQPSIPILFLTDAGTSVAGDIRASSLQEAIRFASRWNLLGIVSAADPLVTCPRLVRVVKESGLVCVSYGMLNNDPANVKVYGLSVCVCWVGVVLIRFVCIDPGQRRHRRCDCR